MSNRLRKRIAARIEQSGPVSVHDYMGICLLDPEDGYYTNAMPFGRSGDFTTAPEISQMFGELVGLWAADCWLNGGYAGPFRLVEIGPGRGVLMADALRAIQGVAAPLLKDAEIVLVEASPQLRDVQRERLDGYPVTWVDHFNHVPAGPAMVIGNEFLDALPIRQLLRTGDGYRERAVGLAGQDLVYTDIECSGPVPDDLPPTSLGDIVEFSPAVRGFATALAKRCQAFGGAGLMIDYGYAAPAPGDTFQAVSAHEFADPLSRPGEADLTVHVDFAAFARAATAAGGAAWGPVSQRDFLRRLGIEARVAQLAKQGGEQAEDIISQYRRLTDADQMGTLFKVAAISASPSQQPSAFDHAELFRP